VKTCRACGEPLRWVVAESTGRSVALDAAPAADGTLYLDRRPTGRLIARELDDGDAAFDGTRYRVHRYGCMGSG
jgi:hypothetical protein